MNFTMMDLERPALRKRHADFCTTDLTGRLLQFYSSAEGVDGEYKERLAELFERIMHNRKKSGSFSNYVEDNAQFNPDTVSAGGHFLSGLVRYYNLTGDMRALNAAIEVAGGANTVYGPEGLSDLYIVTKDEKYLDAIRAIAAGIGDTNRKHSHSYMTALRGILRAGIEADNKEMIELVRLRREEIISGGYIKPNGDVPEIFPDTIRNEGCSIADWIMLNLMWADYTGDEEAYEMAEHSLWNALFFNQFVTGGCGHRCFSPYGYKTYIEEAWWCCTSSAGLAITEFARHAVTMRDGKLHVNFFVPGQYKIMTDKGEVEVSITTRYPTKAYTIIKIAGTKEDAEVRVPYFIKGYECRRDEDALGYTLHINGRMGHYSEMRQGRRIMKYGPMVIAPMTYFWDHSKPEEEESTVPDGYQHERMMAAYCKLALPEPNEDGFYNLSKEPVPMWIIFEEGEMSNFPGGEVAAVNVPCAFPNGETKQLYFQPLFTVTSNLTLMDIVSDFEV